MSTYNHTAIATGAAANAGTVNTPLGTLDAAIGNLTTLTTTAKTSAVAAINEVDADATTALSRIGAAASVSGSIATSIDTDGTLKAGAVDGSGVIANGVVTLEKLSPDVQAGLGGGSALAVNLMWDEVFQHAEDLGNWGGKSWWRGDASVLSLVTSTASPYGSKLLRVTGDEYGKGTYLEEIGLQAGDVISAGMMCKATSGTYRCKLIFRTTGPGASAVSTAVGDYYTFSNDTQPLTCSNVTIPATANWVEVVPDSAAFGTLDIYAMWLHRGATAATYPSPSPFTATYLRLKEWETSAQRLMVRYVDASNFVVYQPQHDDQSWMAWKFTKLATNNWTYYGADACADNAGTSAYGAVTFDIGYSIYYTPSGQSGETCGNHHLYDNFTVVNFYDEAGDTVDPTASGAAFTVAKLRIEQKGTLRHPDTGTTDHATISRFIEITVDHIYEHQRLTWLTSSNLIGYWNTGQLLASSANRAWLHNYGDAARQAADPTITIDNIEKSYTWYSSRKFAFQVECPTADATQIRTSTLKLYPRTINADVTRNAGDVDHAEWYWRVIWDKQLEQRI